MTYTPKPTTCDCRTPIIRIIDGVRVCLNCPLHDAIYESRDDVERVRLLALIDMLGAQEHVAAWLQQFQRFLRTQAKPAIREKANAR